MPVVRPGEDRSPQGPKDVALGDLPFRKDENGKWHTKDGDPVRELTFAELLREIREGRSKAQRSRVCRNGDHIWIETNPLP